MGPNVILDGQGGLTIGDHCDISAGAQIYTHDTVTRSLSGGVGPVEQAPVKIGSCVYLEPQCVIEKGVTIGDGVVIGAISLANRDIPSGARAWGIPATLR
jgi:acetyltransferase-like isoleucine patch superfamily enzyme